MKLNKKITPAVSVSATTHGGAPTSKTSAYNELNRSVLATMLWEDSFYEDGQSIASRISTLVPKVPAHLVANLAVQARTEANLRHVPLLLVREMARLDSHKHLVADTLSKVIQRPDELAEFMAIYSKDKKQPLSAQVKKGLASAFAKFNEYSLAKYNQAGQFKLRDILFLTHAKPHDKAQEKLWKKLIGGYCSKCFCRQDKHSKNARHNFVEAKLETPDTWEVALAASQGKAKKEVWERLLSENKLGALALIRNLRNFTECGVDDNLVKKALKNCNPERVLPFRFISAADHAPRFQPQLEDLMLRSIKKNQLKGKTVLIIDVSGSMSGGLSSKSDLNRVDAAAALAILVREMGEDVVIYATAGNDMSRVHKTELVNPYHGFALRDAIKQKYASLGGGGIFLKQVMDFTLDKEKKADRVIVITDEQDCDLKANPDKAPAYGKENYILNIASYENGIAFKKFNHINGFSESAINYIIGYEGLKN